MARNDQESRDGERNGAQAERYRFAAETALQQLEWAIEYLHRIRKTGIAKALARNCSDIRSRMRKPDVGTPL
jgi:hypothetical protein